MTVSSGLDAFPAELVKGRRVGVVTNQTGINRKFVPVAEVVRNAGGTVAAIFGPEHGYYGVEQDALPVADASRDATTGAPVYSLYREHDYGLGDTTEFFGPPPGSLNGLDALVFDIQDVGCRYYTYPTTLGILLEQVALPVIVIDRPNPLGGAVVEGPLLEAQFRSFVGRYPLPVQHGLTIGELALYINKQILNGKAQVQVAKMQGWQRQMQFEETGLPWVMPSPNLPTPETARLYPGTCLLEGTNLSTGRGTTRPFELFGAPWIDPDKLATTLNSYQLPGLFFRATWFKPTFDRFAGEVCGGVQVHLVEPAKFREIVRGGVKMIAALLQLYPEKFEFFASHFDRLLGSQEPRLLLAGGSNSATLEKLFQGWAEQETTFYSQRADFLLY
jgi:uncharacterized protein YbbC (DUF1343 family)